VALYAAIRFTLVFQLAVWLIVAFFSRSIGSAFSDNPEVVDIISNYLWIIPASYGAHAVTILVAEHSHRLHWRPALRRCWFVLRFCHRQRAIGHCRLANYQPGVGRAGRAAPLKQQPSSPLLSTRATAHNTRLVFGQRPATPTQTDGLL